MNEHLDGVKHLVDVGAVATAVASLVDATPKLAAVLSVFWLAARCYNEVLTAVYRHRDRKRKSRG